MRKREPPPEQRIAGVVGLAAIIGIFPAWYVGVLFVLRAAGESRFPHRHFLAAFGLTCIGALFGCLAICVTDVADAMRPLGALAVVHSDQAALVAALADEAQPGDQLVLMSNGSFGGLHEKLLQALRARTPEAV